MQKFKRVLAKTLIYVQSISRVQHNRLLIVYELLSDLYFECAAANYHSIAPHQLHYTSHE